MLLAAVGNAIAAGTTVVGARFFAMFLMPMGAVSSCKFPTLMDIAPLTDIMYRPDHCLMGRKLIPPSPR